jgi:hypothetical protein
VADMRRTGELPAVTSPAGQIYDHQLEQSATVDADAG